MNSLSLPSKGNPYLKSFLYPLAFGFLLYLGISFFSDTKEVIHHIGKLPITRWALLLALSLMNYGIRFWRWEKCLRMVSEGTVPAWRHFLYYVAGFALTTTPGKLGEGMRAYYLQSYGVSYNATFSTLFAERMMDLLSMLLLALFAILSPHPAIKLLAAGAVCVLLVFIVLRTSLAVRFSEKMLQLPWMPLKQKLTAVPDLLGRTQTLLRQKIFYGGTLAGVIGWGLEGIAFYTNANALGLEQISLPLAIGIYATGVLAGALSFLPGGLGSTEAVMTLLLMASGSDEAAALATAMICRFSTLWFAVVLGFCSVGYLAFTNKPSKTC